MPVLRDCSLAIGLGILAVGAAWEAIADEGGGGAAAVAATQSADNKDRTYFTDLPVVTQDGTTMRFYSDVLKGQVVLINFIFTSCQDACPLITTKLVQAREALPEELRYKVRFVSLSVDTERDTPEAMKKFAEKLGADQPNWLFLTGEKSNLDTIIRRLGQYTGSLEDHSTLLIAGNVKEKHWAKIPPVVPPPGIAAQLAELARDS